MCVQQSVGAAGVAPDDQRTARCVTFDMSISGKMKDGCVRAAFVRVCQEARQRPRRIGFGTRSTPPIAMAEAKQFGPWVLGGVSTSVRIVSACPQCPPQTALIVCGALSQLHARHAVGAGSRIAVVNRARAARSRRIAHAVPFVHPGQSGWPRVRSGQRAGLPEPHLETAMRNEGSRRRPRQAGGTGQTGL